MKVLIAGESWTTFSTHVKGADSFTTSTYAEGVEPLRSTLQAAGHVVDYLPSQKVPEEFPFEAAELDAYDVILLSDVGANSFVLSHRTYKLSQVAPDRLRVLDRWVRDGGGLVMVGGYLSYSGIEGKAAFGISPLAPCLPVELMTTDDRAERPDGVASTVLDPAHPLVAGVDGTWPTMLGYNRVVARPEADLVATIGDGDPLLVGWEYGEGRVTAFTSECAPHWAPPEFLAWEHYSTLWDNIVTWTGSRTPATLHAATISA